MQHEPLTSTSEEQTFALSAPVSSIVEAGPEVTAPVEHTEEDKQAIQAIRRLKRGSGVREPALRACKGLTPLYMKPLLDALQTPVSARWRETQVALWTLGRAPLTEEQKPAAISALTRVLKATVSRSPMHRMVRTRWALGAAIGFAAVGGLSACNDELSRGQTTRWDYVFAMSLLLSIGLSVVFSCVFVPIPYLFDSIYARRRWRVRATALKALGRLGGTESVSTLAAALEDSEPKVRDEALRALLPLLTPTHRGQLRPQVITALCVDIEYKTEAEVLKRLDALETIGDSRALKTLKHMRRYGRTKPVCVRAEQVYQVLEERQAQENAPKMLLRASDASHVAPDVLLRAASADDIADPTQLLRASHSEHPNTRIPEHLNTK